ncbi:class D beta-lactamase [Lusitaniella coriacea]|uniref:class D beta-lactamase n=1 Tax=Lusitaniella coriacea TaxID=1983105 RepID=UPI003CF12363
MNKLFRSVTLAMMVFGFIATLLLSTARSALTVPNSIIESPSHAEVAQVPDFKRHFQTLGIEGSIIIHDSKRDRVYLYNPQRNATPFLPASTFKILNSLISLETGAIADEVAVLTWDGIPRFLPTWNRDLNLREAIKISAVWFYQVLARRVGYESMQKWVTQADYGNQNIGSPEDIDKFWLTGELRITPQEQIQFLRRLYDNELPFSARSLSIVKDIITVEKTPDYTLRAKTGWGQPDTGEFGWFVGYLEQNDNVYFFATNIDIRNPSDASARLEVTRLCLQDLGLL